MNTSRPTSRNAGPSPVSNTGTAPRRKVASMAQMDISSMATAFQAPPSVKPVSYSGGGSTISSSSSSRPILVSTNSSASLNGGQSTPGGPYTNVAPPRLSSVNRGRSSNSVATTASYRSTTSAASNATATGHSGNGYNNNGRATTVAGTTGTTGGSVTSDDGTVSEDSDRAAAGDEMQLVSGGNTSSSLTYGSSGRHASASSAAAAAGPTAYSPSSGQSKYPSSRTRTSSSTIGLSNGNSGMNSSNNSGTSTPTHKPMRIAAGASIKVETSPPSVSTISSSTGTTVASLLTVRSGNNNNNNGGGDDGGSAVSGISSTASGISLNASQLQQQLQQQQQSQQQQQQSLQPTVRSVKPTGATTTSNASATAAATKLAEENRRQEEAARTRRKIADLEISNASLLSINSSLEATIRKQASEMQELKIRMQSSQYGGSDLNITAADLALAQSVEAIELTEAEKQDELTFKRLCLTIEQMVFEAKQALDQSLKPTGVKVLTLYDMYEKEQQEEAAAAAAKAEAEAGGETGIEGTEEQDTSALSIPKGDLDGDDYNLDQEMDFEDTEQSDGYSEKRDSVLDEDSKDQTGSSVISLKTSPLSSTTKASILDPSFASTPPATSSTVVTT